MDKISLKRKNGYLLLDDYFQEKLGRDFVDLEDLMTNGLAEVESSGISEKFWILSDDGSERMALFKEPDSGQDSNQVYAELFAEEIAKVLGMRTAHYDLAKFQGRKGVISYNFLNEFDTYWAGFDVISEFYENKLKSSQELSALYGIDYFEDTIKDVSEKLNNLEDIWIILEERFGDDYRKDRIVYRLVDSLVDKLIFDVLTVNADDHSDQWAIIDTLEDGKILSPQFDSARILNLHKNILNDYFRATVENNELLLTADNTKERKPLEVLEHFLDISSSEYRDRVIDKVNRLQENIDIIPERIEQRTEHAMPNYLKKYFTSTMHEHMDKVNEVIHGKKNTK